MASLESLLASLPLLIAKNLPDLNALDAPWQSCAHFVAGIARHAIELLEHLMLATLHEEVVLELRGHVILVADFDRWWRTDMAVERLYEDTQKPLPRNIPVEAVSLTLRTLSFLQWLGARSATARLQELYALPHLHANSGFTHIS